MIERLTAILRQAGLDPTARELADVLWLAERSRPIRTSRAVEADIGATGAASVSAAQPHADAPKDGTTTPPPRRPLHGHAHERRAGVYPEGGRAATAAGAVLRSPTATALPGALALGRALRPLKRRVPSRVRVEIDEARTADRIAQGLRPTVVVRPAPTRWLDLALVIDDAASMTIWRRTVVDLRTLLARHGAFRDVHVYQLVTDEGPELRVLKGVSCGARREVSKRELYDASGQRLVLVVSDCVTPAWDNGRVGALLNEWGRHGPVAIVQVLPERLWQRSGLGAAEMVRLRAPMPGMRNAGLMVERLLWDLTPGEAVQGLTAVPVVELEAASMAMWARMLAGSDAACAPGVILSTTSTQIDSVSAESEAGAEEPTAEERVMRFRSMAEPEARKLATLFAAAPLSLPVMRIIRETMLPHAKLGHLAEVFLGGLLRKVVEGEEPIDPDYVRYDFFDGVRERLLDSASSEEAMGVLEHVSAYVTAHLGSSLDFRVLLADPAAVATAGAVSAADRPFAEIGASVLRRLGGDYAKLGEQLARGIAEDASAATFPSSGSNPPEERPVASALAGAPEDTVQIEPTAGTSREQALGAGVALERLRDYAREYESIRRRMSPSPERTHEMNMLVDVISRESRAWKWTSDVLTARFLKGGEGDRLAVLAVLLNSPNPDCFELIRLGISDRKSAFEQYTALRASREMLASLSSDQKKVLFQALVYERSGAEGTWINDRDLSRWFLSKQIIDILQGPLHVVLMADLTSDSSLSPESLNALLPPGSHVVMCLSDFGVMPTLGRAISEAHWSSWSEAVTRMVAAAHARAEAEDNKTQYYLGGRAPLPIFMQLGMEMSSLRPVTLLNQRSDDLWQLVPLDGSKQVSPNEPIFQIIQRHGTWPGMHNNGWVAVVVAANHVISEETVRRVIELKGYVLAAVVQVSATLEGGRSIDASNAAMAIDELTDLFARQIGSAYSNCDGLAVFVAGTATLAYLVGRAIPTNLFDNIWVPDFKNGAYQFGVELSRREPTMQMRGALVQASQENARPRSALAHGNSIRGNRADVFVSYADRDHHLWNALKHHILRIEKDRIHILDYDAFLSGSPVNLLTDRTEGVKLVLVLLSADYLASDYHFDVELKGTLRRHEAGELKVLPILLRPVNLDGFWSMGLPCVKDERWFEEMGGLPRDGTAVSRQGDLNAACIEIAEVVHRIISGFLELSVLRTP